MRSRFWLAFAFLVAFAVGLYIFRKETMPRQQMSYRRGLDYARAGKYGLALAQLDNSLVYEPDFAPAYNNIGVIYSRMGRQKDAISALEKAVQLDPAFSEARYNLGKVYLELLVEERALEHLREAFRLNPDYDKAREAIAEVYYRIARGKYSEGQYNQAEHNVSRAYEHSPQRADILALRGRTEEKLGRYERAMELFREAAALDPNLDLAEDVSEALGSKGELLYGRGEYDDAERYLRKSVEKSRENVRATYYLGLCYARLKNVEKAIPLLEKGVQYGAHVVPHTEFARMHLSHADQLRKLRNHKGAIKQYRLARAIDPSLDVSHGLAESNYWLAKDLSSRQDAPGALSHFKEASKLAPEEFKYRIDFAEALMEANEYERAVYEYETILRTKPRSPVILYSLGKALLAAARYDEALSELQKAKDLDPGLSIQSELADTYYGRASRAEERGDFAAAAEDYKKAVNTIPDHRDAGLRVGICAEEMGYFPAAIEIYKRYLGDPNLGERALYRLGISYAESGDDAEAMDCAELFFIKGDEHVHGRRDLAAIESYRKVTEIIPRHFHAYLAIGYCYFREKQYEEAAGAFKKCLEIEPGSPEANNNLGVVYEAMGRYKMAEKMLHEAMRFNQQYWVAAVNLSKLYRNQGKDDESRWWSEQVGRMEGLATKDDRLGLSLR